MGMTIENVLEILEKHKLHIPSNVFYELKADIVNFEESTTKNDLGVDCISREQALEWVDNLRKMDECFGNHKGDYFPLSEVIDRLQNVPSVSPQEPCDKCEVGNPCLYCKHEFEAKTGNWYRQTNDYVDYYECSECGMAMGLYDVKNYCPNCGSRNEVEE